jgi:hypothetical protein
MKLASIQASAGAAGAAALEEALLRARVVASRQRATRLAAAFDTGKRMHACACTVSWPPQLHAL